MNMTDEPTPQPAVTPLKKPHSAQDQAKANLINARRTSLLAVKGHPETAVLLNPRGFDAEGLDEGLGICDDAQAKFNARRLATDERDATARLMKKLDKEVHENYAGFSRIGARVFQDNPTAKAAVVVPARDLKDQEKFLTNVDAAYNAVLTRSTYLAALSKRGYTQAVLLAEQKKLQDLSQLSAHYEAAKSAAIRATSERDAAIKALTRWWGEFQTTAKVAFKDRPDLLKLLEE
jgi:hypothetical protein